MNNKISSKDLSFAEVIESNLSSWTSQCWNWQNIPSFGSLVTTSHEDSKIFGIVHTITTGSADTNRIPTTYQKTKEELLTQQPQIFEFLQTTFSSITIGYQENNKTYYHLAQKPPQIHNFVQNAQDETYKLFFENEQFLSLLFNISNQIFNLDELLLAFIKHIKEKKLLDANNIQQFIESFAMHSKNDYQALKVFLHRTEQLIKN